MSHGRPVAAVDVGTNSVRLLVLDGDGEPLDRAGTVTRLGTGIDATGHFDDTALETTLAYLAELAERWRAAGVADDDVRIAATSAARDASDRQRFFDGVRDRTGVEAEVLTGDEEAACSFLGATAGRPVGPGDVLVLDVGGGSTELVVGRDGEVVAAVSLQLGTVRLTERTLHGDPPTADEVAAAEAVVRTSLDAAADVLATLDATSAPEVVAVAGTATTLAGMAAGIARWESGAVDGRVVSRAEVADLASRLLALPAARRGEVGLLQPGREDVIAAGALIVRAVLDRVGADGFRTSERDVLDGLAASLR